VTYSIKITSSAVVGAIIMQPNFEGTVCVFRQKFAIEDTIASHACSLEASMRATYCIPVGSSLFLPVDTANHVATLQVVL
jgi:hypothetical protein